MMCYNTLKTDWLCEGVVTLWTTNCLNASWL